MVGEKGRGKKIPSSTVVNYEISQEEQQPGPSWQSNKLARSLNYKSNDEDLPAKLASFPVKNWGINDEISFNAKYENNMSAKSAMVR